MEAITREEYLRRAEKEQEKVKVRYRTTDWSESTTKGTGSY